MKNYNEWNDLKKDIEINTKRIAICHEREIWWCSIGINVGDEQDGKNGLFERPVLVLKKFNNRVAWVMPLTSKRKNGIHYYEINLKGKNVTIILSQLRLISILRFRRLMGKISQFQFEKIKNRLIELIR